MSRHEVEFGTCTALVKVDVDRRIFDAVVALNAIPGVRTHTSCQGTIGEGGPHPYRGYVTITWAEDVDLARVARIGEIWQIGAAWGYIFPFADADGACHCTECAERLSRDDIRGPQ